MSSDIERLTASEAFALAGLARVLIRQDGQFTEDEQKALSRIAVSVAVVEEAALEDGSMPTPIGEESLYGLIERAGEELGDDKAIRAAAKAVTRKQAQEIIYAMLFDVAASDVVMTREGSVLEWVAEAWQLEVATPLEGERTDAG